jgi:hypothetical protein
VSEAVRGGRTVAYLVERGRLESFTSENLAATAVTLVQRAARRLETTARAALDGGDVDGAYVAAYGDPDAAPITEADASWALEKAGDALSGARSVLASAPPGRSEEG